MNTPLSPDFPAHVVANYDKLNAMRLIKATLTNIEEGAVEVHVPHWDGIEQQHGYIHGGIVGMIADTAAGFAAMTVTPADASVLTVEYKLNFVAPSKGEKLIARGAVIRAGQTLIVTKADVYGIAAGVETLCAVMQQTIIVKHASTAPHE
ncbi:PaaI family thioesterase [Paraburkholderia sp. BCC1886]|uniref:PaaI family thioesterase n=1 Tax=Paraburkholderia sp. BCC1886 TaxID=2562670 RepID=UPI001C9195C3|nr:PaaI family thioesterase [Paraburkholderia sp. BCC1886]